MREAERIMRRALAGSKLDTKGWDAIQAGLRDRAFFSAQVESLKILAAARSEVAEIVQGKSESEARRDLRAYLTAQGYKAPDGKEKTIKDLMTKARLDVLLKTNRDQVRGYVKHLEETDDLALAVFPAWELVRARESKQPRDWKAKWTAKGGKLVNGRMIALKSEAIWEKISRFGTPYAPFDFGSKMVQKEISRKECLELGLVKEGDKPQTVKRPGMNDSLVAEVSGIRTDSNEAKELYKAFGDQIDISNGLVRWKGSLVDDVIRGEAPRMRLGEASAEFLGAVESFNPGLAKSFKGKQLGFSNQFFREHGGKHFESGEIPIQDFQLLPSMWRRPDRVKATRDPGRVRIELDCFDGGTLAAIVDADSGLKSIQKARPRANA